MRLNRFFQKNSPPATSNGITCSLEELLELRHTTRAFGISGGRQAHSLLAGNTHSRFRGRGMDYEESRIYTPGDDVRNIDWRVTARSGKVHSKLFTEERDRPVITLVDFSPSLYFGTKNAFKSVVAARLAATVAWSAVLNHDRIGGIIQTPETSFDLRPRPGRKGVLALIHALVKACRAHDRTGALVLESILHQAQQSIRPGSRVFLISDFYGLNAGCERSLSQLRRHNDLVLCQVIDPLEMSPPAA
ncbi:MAG: DUF58 domain-containing protein, partial [Deltaproteobacteria bacterium]|nr:DUF58 domain-containing protein [Deltaproteobacteria bacterium]